jgi:hypothetical protein
MDGAPTLLRDRMRERIPTLNYSRFCREIDVELEPVQQAIARIAYDHEPPRAGTETADAEYAFARLMPDMWLKHWMVFVAVCGARAGKSYTLAALRLLHLALTLPLTTLAPGEIAVGLIVAPDERLAQQTLRYVGGALQHPTLEGWLVGEPGIKRIVLQRPHDGKIVAIECLPATGGGSAVRARSLIGAVMEEAAFFMSEGHVVNDDEIFNAIVPRLLPGAQLIVDTTPWLRKGLHYRLLETNLGTPSTALAVRASTSRMRPSMAAFVEEQRKLDPDNTMREYDAIALSAGAGVFFDPAAIRLAVTSEAFVPEPGDEVIAAADFGFRVNASTLVIGYRRGDITWIVDVVEIRPEPDLPLVPSEVLDQFAIVLAKYRCDSILCDSHGQEKVLPYAQAKGLTLQFVATSDKTKFHITAKVALAQNQVRLPNHSRLLKQMREIVGQPIGGGMISIKSPQWKTGEHGDLASAAVLVISANGGDVIMRTVDMSDANERIRRDTLAHWEAEKERILEQQREQNMETCDPMEEAWGRIA